jgi:hypothetical protein
MAMKIHAVEFVMTAHSLVAVHQVFGESYILLRHDCPTPRELPQAITPLSCIRELIFSLDPQIDYYGFSRFSVNTPGDV